MHPDRPILRRRHDSWHVARIDGRARRLDSELTAHNAYVEQITSLTRELQAQGYLLKADANSIIPRGHRVRYWKSSLKLRIRDSQAASQGRRI